MSSDPMSIGGARRVVGAGPRKGGRHVYAEHAHDAITVIGGGHVYACTPDRRVAARYLAQARRTDRAWRQSQSSWLPQRRISES